MAVCSACSLHSLQPHLVQQPAGNRTRVASDAAAHTWTRKGGEGVYREFSMRGLEAAHLL